MAAVSLPREIRDFLDLHDERPDAGAFAMAIFRKASGPLRAVHNRAVSRSGVRAVTINDGPRRKRIRLRSPAGDTPAKLAARFAVLVARRPDLVLDEARRWVLRMPQGPRGLDGETLDPRIADAAARPRHLFGIDDAILIGIAVPILVAVIPQILPMLLQWGGDAAQTIGAAVVGAAAGPVDEPGTDADDEIFGFPRDHVMAAAILAVVVVVALR